MSRQPKKYYPIDQSPLYRLRSRKRLAEILFVSVKALQEFSSNGKSKALYREWDTTSKSGKLFELREELAKEKNSANKVVLTRKIKSVQSQARQVAFNR